MSKLVKNVVIASFIGQFCDLSQRVDTLVTDTALNIFKGIFNSIGIGYFNGDKEKQVLKNGVDSGLKKTLSAMIPIMLTEQAEACTAELEAIPDELWSGTPQSANLSIFKVIYTADSGRYTLNVGSMFRRVRSVLMHVANEQGRMALWDLVNADNARELYNEQYEEWNNRETAGNTAESNTDENNTSDNSPSPDDDGGNSISVENIPSVLGESLTRLTAALHATELSKGQQGAVARMIDDISDHVDSLGANVEAEAPKVSVKKDTAKQAASK